MSNLASREGRESFVPKTVGGTGMRGWLEEGARRSFVLLICVEAQSLSKLHVTASTHVHGRCGLSSKGMSGPELGWTAAGMCSGYKCDATSQA